MPPEVFVEETASSVPPIAGVPTTIAAFIGTAKRGTVNKPARVQSFAEFEQQFGGLAAGCELGYAVRQFFVNGGTDAFVVRIAKNASVAKVLKGIRSLNSVDFFALLALPGITAPAVLAGAADYCRDRRAFLLVDPPQNVRTAGEMEQFVRSGALPKTSNAAIYFPWTKISDPLDNGQPRAVSPSGTIAGVIARTDSARGVWKSPAGPGANLLGVKGLETNLTDHENEPLNALGVNCLRVFPAFGAVAWGARTLASDWKYIPVRRTALFLEESIHRGTTWAVFEPNDEPLWAQIRLAVGAFLQSLFVAGAFQGSAPRDAFFVKCDAQTTTTADIANSIANIVVGFAPLRPAEFVVIKIQRRIG